ncbi:hypothetical protein [Peribacillus frigoritolerans]|uniref:hypothetical protein n=1 Tax=Peribacillus frigoritolerans TaxID=450367 RepID=UPI003B8E674F
MLKTTHVIVRWNPRNINYYKKFGYKFTKVGESFKIPVEHLIPGNKKNNLEIICDYCGEIFPRSNSDHQLIKNKKRLLPKLHYKKMKENIIKKKDEGILTKDDNGYWSFKENRLRQFKQYIEAGNDVSHMYIHPEGQKIILAFKRYNHSLKDALAELGYDIHSLDFSSNSNIPTYHGFFRDFENVKTAIEKFITNYEHFPTIDEMEHTLGINRSNIDFHGGVDAIRRKLNYFNKDELIDDNGFKNNSIYEYIVAQFLIHNAKIPYKREQLPFSLLGKKYRSDFTLEPKGEEPIHTEVWGGSGKRNNSRRIVYQRTKEKN